MPQSLNIWTMARGVHPETIGVLPMILMSNDPRPVKDQLDDRYSHGGGYSVSPGNWKYIPAEGENEATLQYTSTSGEESDEALREMARTQIHDETCILFDYQFMAIVQPDASFVVVRVD